MLVKLLPDQVLREWEVIKHAIMNSTYEQIFSTDDKVRDHLREILLGTMHVWAVLDAQEQLVAVGTTRFSHDLTMGVRRLEIYSLYGFKEFTLEQWAECFVSLQRFAKAQNCSYIIALSDQERIIQMAQKVGGDSSQRLLVFNV